METMYLIPISASDITSENAASIIALYKTSDREVINVGKPYLMAYYPALANMYGFRDASKSDYYYMTHEEIKLLDKPVYRVVVSNVLTIASAELLNEVEDDSLLSTLNSLDKTLK